MSPSLPNRTSFDVCSLDVHGWLAVQARLSIVDKTHHVNTSAEIVRIEVTGIHCITVESHSPVPMFSKAFAASGFDRSVSNSSVVRSVSILPCKL